MKATELMIRDWIMWKPQRGGFIGIVGGDEAFKPELTRVRASHLESMTLDDYFPIPLTPEILEKNENVKELGYWDKETNVFRLFAVPIVNLWDVHILQHALRLCGLNELADNFKV